MKRVWAAIGIFFLVVIFVEPLRNYMNGLFRNGRVKEEGIAGSISDYNPRVRDIQKVLKKEGFYSGVVDGFIGGQTRKAVKEFQKANNLQATGSVDSATLTALSEAEKTKTQKEIQKAAPSGNERPKQIQVALKNAGFYKGAIDGKIGPLTKEAVMIFQKEFGLKVDGVVGENTWLKLKDFI